MALTPGTRLGVYEITALLGEGGMGQVFRARDTKLDRDVALKILPEAFAHDADRLARFTREAKTLASLNHPHIAAIYGLEESDGITALVMELVEGEDLSQRIAKGAIPIDEALPIAKQIAGALEAAHDQGIIHRDLKPANVKVRSDGTVKVFDFGLAKAMEPTASSSPSPSASLSPTLTSPAMTQAGVILGTAAYMSPEQARGKAVDRRTDVWAFGCVFYEMLTGRRAFDGEDVVDTLSNIMKRAPDWSVLPVTTPAPIRRLLRRCLEKERPRRLESAGDARLEVEDAMAASDADSGPQGSLLSTASKPQARLPWVVAAVALVAAVGATFLAYAKSTTGSGAQRPMRANVLPPPGTFIGGEVLGVAPARVQSVSPDGTLLAISASGPAGVTQLWIRNLSDGTYRRLDGTEGVQYPFWAPNGRSVGYWANNHLWRVDIGGGAPVAILDIGGNVAGATWNQDNDILFSVALAGVPIRRVSANGGPPTNVTSIDETTDETRHFSPSFLPDGRHFLFLAIGTHTDPVEPAGVFVGSLDSAARMALPGISGNAQYANGYLVFPRGRDLLAQPFDWKGMRTSGEPIALASGVQIGGPEGVRAAFSVSQRGDVAFIDGDGVTGRLVWFDRFGRAIASEEVPGPFSGFALSQNAQRVAVAVTEGSNSSSNSDIWLLELDGERRRVRLTSDPAIDDEPVFNPDGKEVFFRKLRPGNWSAFRKATASGGEERPLFTASNPNVVPAAISQDGATVLYRMDRTKTLAIAPAVVDPKLVPLVGIKGPVELASFGPSARWIAYDSSESGRREVFIGRTDRPAERWPVSLSGGRAPVWRSDGRKLYFIGAANTLFDVDVTLSKASVEVGAPRLLFQLPLLQGQGHQFAVASDGQRFLAAIRDPRTSDTVSIIQNWPSLTRR